MRLIVGNFPRSQPGNRARFTRPRSMINTGLHKHQRCGDELSAILVRLGVRYFATFDFVVMQAGHPTITGKFGRNFGRLGVTIPQNQYDWILLGKPFYCSRSAKFSQPPDIQVSHSTLRGPLIDHSRFKSLDRPLLGLPEPLLSGRHVNRGGRHFSSVAAVTGQPQAPYRVENEGPSFRLQPSHRADSHS